MRRKKRKIIVLFLVGVDGVSCSFLSITAPILLTKIIYEKVVLEKKMAIESIQNQES